MPGCIENNGEKEDVSTLAWTPSHPHACERDVHGSQIEFEWRRDAAFRKSAIVYGFYLQPPTGKR